MPNTNVFTGMDGSITVAVADADSVEGAAASAVVDAFALSPIGRALNVTLNVVSATKPFHELGQSWATQIRNGNVDVSGTIGRAQINGGLLRLMLGDGAAGNRPQGPFARPVFNLSLLLENPAHPGTNSAITVHGVKINGWDWTLLEDDFVVESVSFKALWIAVEDAEGGQ